MTSSLLGDVQSSSGSAPGRQPPATIPLITLLLACAFSFGAITTVAWSEHYHVNCVSHGFVHGSSTADGSFHAQVIHGCGQGTKRCQLYTKGVFDGGYSVSGSADCVAWSLEFGSYSECASTAHTYYSGTFSDHVHKAHNWCG